MGKKETTTTTLTDLLESPALKPMFEETAHPCVRCECGELDRSGLFKMCAGVGETYALTYEQRLYPCEGCGKGAG